MSDYNSQYDPHIPKNGGSGAGYFDGDSGASSGGNTKTSNIQRDIDQTTKIMRDNIQAVQERGERLDDLTDKTASLQNQAQGFRRGANNVRKKMWWKDMKMRIIIGVGLIILILLIVIPIIVRNK